MHLSSLLSFQALWLAVSSAMQHFPSWGHYDMCKTQIHSDEGTSWDYMACQPEATIVTKFLNVTLDPPSITCGTPAETYCTLENPYMCNNECDASTPELAHPPELMLDHEGRIPNTFWQSVSWKNYPRPLLVNITLSWNKTIELTEDIIITFESERPEQMILEKSLDYGQTWQPYQFYAADCLNAFRMEPKTVHDLTQKSVLDIICTEEYSRGYVWKMDKMVRFEIKDRFALFGGPHLHNMASLYGQLDTTKNLRDFFTVTDLRIRLLRPATGATIVDERNLSKYFYAISNIEIQGRCKCNLHANNCILDNGKLACVCEHNTTGQDCGRCKKAFQGQPWRSGSYLPIPKGTANICFPNTISSRPHPKHDRTQPSVSSLEVAIPKQDCKCNPFGSVHDRCNGTGVCDCKKGTTGAKCDECLPGYYWHKGCRPNVCDNELMLCQNGGKCLDHRRCQCPATYTGVLCEKRKCEKGVGGCSSNSAQGPASHNVLLLLTALLPAVTGFLTL
uniref:Netrin G1 n=1 Tax=Callorhinchus milii TaxID=7868 RepID=A0A4W3ILW8_CALMI